MGIKISELPLASNSNNEDILVTVQNNATKKTTKEIFLEDVNRNLNDVYTKTQTDNLLNVKANQDDLDETNVFVNNLRTRMSGAEGHIMDLQTGSGHTIEISMNPSTYVLTATLKNANGSVISTATVDLPIESLVKDVQYDSETKEIVFILQDGTTRRIPLSDLISGLQAEITEQNKLSSDLVDDTNKTNKFVTTSEKTAWNAKYDKPNNGIPKADLANDVQASLNKADTAIQEHQDISGKEDKSNKTTELTNESTDIQYPSAKAVYDSNKEQDSEIEKLQNRVTDLEETVNDELADGTATGTEITVNDSATADASLFPNGNTSQVHTNGYQLIHQIATNQNIEMGGLYLQAYADGTYRIYGTTTANVQALINIDDGEWKSVGPTNYSNLEAGTYNYKVHFIEGTSARFRARSGNSNLTNYGNTGEFTLESDVDNFNLYFYLSSGNTIDCKFKIMLEEGTTAHDWEFYSNSYVSPSTNYQQPIHILKGSNTIKIQNKNWLPNNGENTLTKQGVTFIKQSDDSIFINGTSTGTSTDYYLFGTAIDEGEYISIPSGTYALPEIDTTKIRFMAREKTLGTLSGRNILNALSLQDCQFYGFFVRVVLNQTLNNTVIYPQLEKGVSATNYVLHKRQTKTLTLPTGLEMCNIEDYRDVFEKDLTTDKWYKNKKVNKYVFTGNETPAQYTSTSGAYVYAFQNLITNYLRNNANICICSHFISQENSGYSVLTDGKCNFRYSSNDTNKFLYIATDDYTSVEEFKAFLAEQYQNGTPVTLYYILETPVQEEITDTTLIAELDDLYETLRTYYGQTNITVEAEDLEPMMTLSYKETNRNLNNELELIKARLDLLES